MEETMEKIILSIPSDLLQEMNSASEKLKKNRSQIIRQAIAEFLSQLKQKEFEQLMAEGYQETFQTNSAIVNDSLELQAEVAGKVWDCDE
jgi:CopG family transcriptional regulator / antitoxin EndoAI